MIVYEQGEQVASGTTSQSLDDYWQVQYNYAFCDSDGYRSCKTFTLTITVYLNFDCLHFAGDFWVCWWTNLVGIGVLVG